MSWSSYVWRDSGNAHVIIRDEESGKCYLTGCASGGAQEEILPPLFEAAVKTVAASGASKEEALQAASQAAKKALEEAASGGGGGGVGAVPERTQETAVEEAFAAVDGYLGRLGRAEKSLRERATRASEKERLLTAQEILASLREQKAAVNRNLDDMLHGISHARRPPNSS